MNYILDYIFNYQFQFSFNNLLRFSIIIFDFQMLKGYVIKNFFKKVLTELFIYGIMILS